MKTMSMTRPIEEDKLSRVIQVDVLLENNEINQNNFLHLFVIALLYDLVFYELFFGSLHTTTQTTD